MTDKTTHPLWNRPTDCPGPSNEPPNTTGASSGCETAPTCASDLSYVIANDRTAQTTILRLRDVSRRTGLGRSSIYSRMAEGTFPPALKLGDRAVGWRERDIEAWIASRPVVIHAYRAAK